MPGSAKPNVPILMGVVVLASLGCHHASTPAARPNLVLITVDTLRPDRMSLYDSQRTTTPALDAFFGEGHRYERAYATEASTSPSVVSILSGLYPQRHRTRLHYQHVPDDIRIVTDYLRPAGYSCAGIVSNIVLTNEAIGWAARFDHYDDFVDEREPNRPVYERRASRTTAATLQWLQQRAQDNGPFFLWVHYIDPHAPYAAPAGESPRNFTHTGSSPVPSGRMVPYAMTEGVDDGLEYVDRYDEEIAYVDQEIGRLLQYFGANGLVENSVFVFTSDHGETMMEHEAFFAHGYHVWEPIARVPLAIRAPNSTAHRITANVSLVDLLPTLLRHASVDIPDGLDGRVLGERSDDEVVFVEASAVDGRLQQRAAIEGTQKLFATVDTNGGVVATWSTDLAHDPGEVEQSPWPSDPAAQALLEKIRSDPDPGGRPRQFTKGMMLTAPKVAPGRSPEQLEALRSLGYVQ